MLLYQMRLLPQRLVILLHLILLLEWQLDQLLPFLFGLVLLLLVVVVVLLTHRLNQDLVVTLLLGHYVALLRYLVFTNASDLHVFSVLLFLLEQVLLLGFLVRLYTFRNILTFLLHLHLFVFCDYHISHLIHDRLDLIFAGLYLFIAFLDLSFLDSFRLVY